MVGKFFIQSKRRNIFFFGPYVILVNIGVPVYINIFTCIKERPPILKFDHELFSTFLCGTSCHAQQTKHTSLATKAHDG